MTVTTSDHGAARVITWDRQDRRNAWDLPTMTAIAAEIDVAGRDTDVRMVAVRGAGGHFSAGDDLQAAIEADTAAWTETIEAFQRMTRVVLAAPVPVVAVVDGVCVGGALEFAASSTSFRPRTVSERGGVRRCDTQLLMRSSTSPSTPSSSYSAPTASTARSSMWCTRRGAA